MAELPHEQGDSVRALDDILPDVCRQLRRIGQSHPKALRLIGAMERRGLIRLYFSASIYPPIAEFRAVMAHIAPDRLILQLSDDELEKFVREWALRRSGSVEVKLLSGAGDRGRDVVGYHTTKRDEGPWDNYQCKQYGSTLPTAIGLLDIGKVLYYTYRGEFTAPAAFFFVAPRGVNRTLRRLLLKPSEFQATLMNDWATYCAGKIVAGQHIPLDAGLRAFIEAWDFSRIRSLSVHDLLDDPVSQPLMATWFDLDPGPPPAGVVPAEVEQREMPYIEQLLDAYSERDGQTFRENHAGRQGAPTEYGPHLDMQRERFFVRSRVLALLSRQYDERADRRAAA